MFKEEDYREYFESIRRVELDMIAYCDSIINKVDEPVTRGLIEQIRKDEVAHARLADNLLAMLDD